MEWSKIKTMFIYIFLMFNIFLLGLYIYTVDKNKAETYLERDAIIKSIKNDNIEIIEPQIKKDSLNYISAKTYEFKSIDIKGGSYSYEIISDNNFKKLVVWFDEAITNINKDDNYKEKLRIFINEKLNRSDSYIFDEYDEKSNEIIYRQSIDDLKIFNNKNAQIEFRVSDNGDVKYMAQTLLVDIQKDKLESIAGYTQVIYKLYHENYIPKNSRVTASLGYYSSVQQFSNQVLVPSWRVEVYYRGVKNYYYVDAVSIKILK